jgi:hypothetical protein
MLPAPLAGHDDPADAVQVQVVPVISEGSVSVTVAAPDALGPFCRTTTVYWMGEPGTATSWPSVLVTLKSACGVSVSVSVALSLAGLGSVTPAGTDTVAVFASVPVAAGAMVAVAVKVALPPGARLTGAEIGPAPLPGQVEPAVATQLQAVPVSEAGKGSASVAAPEALGPAFEATIV